VPELQAMLGQVNSKCTVCEALKVSSISFTISGVGIMDIATSSKHQGERRSNKLQATSQK
jgi:hypothetical protein